MKKHVILVILALTLIGCKSTRIGETRNVQVRLLDDYTLPDSLRVQGTLVGGLSDIDFQDETLYVVSDDPGTPRLYSARMVLEGEQIDTIVFEEVIKVAQDTVLKEAHLDMEGILFYPEQKEFLISSEGAIQNGKDPMIFKISESGAFKDSIGLPENFLAASSKKPRNNGSLEGLSRSFDQRGFWAAMELPLVTDGPKPKLIRTKSPVRITHFDRKTGEATHQFPYRLEPIAKIPWLYFAVNGVTALLEYAPDKFLIVERGFAAGHGSKGNTVRIFDVDARLATNTLDRNNLRVVFHNPAKKTLLYDFKWAKKFLNQDFIDNIEGISLGPVLPNGNQSLLLLSDNNFNSLGKQINQVVLLEFIPKL